MSEAIDLQDARTAPALVWQQLDQLKGEALLEWRMAPVENGRPAAERNIDGLPMPFGWFALCYSDELAVGEVKPLHYFERELVLWRGEDGTPRLLDAYCPHLGAHMGYGGKVDGPHLQCPF
ncbi:MAG: Rieske 2Fe-2S domain-containing protein, partial [Gammaproteobacteria bacterium]|nr:Rieske 2Fe-2S domain-containing protein [Gammaproteobacteria bacterium]